MEPGTTRCGRVSSLSADEPAWLPWIASMLRRGGKIVKRSALKAIWEDDFLHFFRYFAVQHLTNSEILSIHMFGPLAYEPCSGP